MALLGIDFGTANLRVAVAPQRGEPRLAEVCTVPAIVSFNGTSINAGDPVLLMAGVVPDIVVPGLKRLLGRSPQDELVGRLGQRLGFQAVLEEGGLALTPRAGDSVKGLMAVEVAATELLRYALAEVTDAGPHQAVCAVPGWFSIAQRTLLMRVARAANVRILRFTYDVVAASLWAAHAHRTTGRVLVMDVGAGGVSGALMQLERRSVELLQIAGSAAQGGDDVDAQLAATAVDAPARRDWELVRQACEALKRELTDHQTAAKEVQLGGKTVALSVEAWELDLMLGGLSQGIGDVVKQLSLSKGDAQLDSVLVFGGMSMLGAVQREIASVAQTPIIDGPPRCRSVALGALRIAMSIVGTRPMRHDVVDGEGEETAAPLTTPMPPPAESARASQALRGPPVTRQKVVLRTRPDVTRRRVDPKLVRRGNGEHDDASPRTNAESSAPPAPSEPPPPSAPPPPLRQRIGSLPRRLSDGEMHRVRSRVSAVPTERMVGRPAKIWGRPTHPPPAPADDAPRRPSSIPATGDDGPISSAPPAARTGAGPSPAPGSTDPPETAPYAAPSYAPPPRRAHPPPPPSAGTKYPARDGMKRYPSRDRALRAPALPNDPQRRGATTQPSVRPGPMVAPNSTPPGDPLSPGSDPPIDVPKPSSYPPAPYSTAPPSARPTLAPSQLPSEGTIVCPKTASHILAMPITGGLTANQLEPIALPVLLRRVLARRNFYGTCTIRAEDYELQLDCEEGTASLTKGEYGLLLRAFDLPRAEWSVSATRIEEPLREPIPIARLALEGVRRLLREQPAASCREALRDRLELAPHIPEARRRIPKRLGLARRELRFIDNYFDGTQSGADLGDTGPLGASTCFQLFILLQLYDAIAWDPVKTADEAPIARKLDELADKLESSNAFAVMQVHWSANDEELAARYRARQEEFATGSDNHQINPQACERIRRAIEDAWAILSHPLRRVQHRNESFEGQDFDAATRLAAHRSRGLAMRGMEAEAEEQALRAKDIARSISRPNMKATKPPDRDA